MTSYHLLIRPGEGRQELKVESTILQHAIKQNIIEFPKWDKEMALLALVKYAVNPPGGQSILLVLIDCIRQERIS
jgi:hypothetical protein